MSRFSKYRHHYITPERITTADARERRLAAVLEREHRAQAILPAGALLSPGSKNNRSSVARSIVNDDQTSRQKLSSTLSAFSERDFADPAKRKQYRLLRQAELARQNVKPTGSDKRHFSPTGKQEFNTVYGTAASISRRARAAWSPVFKLSHLVIPCIQRSVRREVMFALGHGGRGYHKRKRRTASSEVPC